MRKFWNVFRQDLVSSLLITGLVYLFMLALNLIGVYVIIGGLHNTPVFPLAGISAFLTAVLLWIVSAPLSLRKHFMLAVSMSTTRGNYILIELLQTVLCSLILYAVCSLLYHLEDGILIPLFYSDFPRLEGLPFSTVLLGSLSSGVLWALSFAGVALGVRLFLGSLLIRLGQILFWILWGIWMCLYLLISGMDKAILTAAEQKIYDAAGLLNGCFLPLLCCIAGIVISCIGVLLLKKQEVRCI